MLDASIVHDFCSRWLRVGASVGAECVITTHTYKLRCSRFLESESALEASEIILAARARAAFPISFLRHDYPARKWFYCCRASSYQKEIMPERARARKTRLWKWISRSWCWEKAAACLCLEKFITKGALASEVAYTYVRVCCWLPYLAGAEKKTLTAGNAESWNIFPLLPWWES